MWLLWILALAIAPWVMGVITIIKMIFASKKHDGEVSPEKMAIFLKSRSIITQNKEEAAILERAAFLIEKDTDQIRTTPIQQPAGIDDQKKIEGLTVISQPPKPTISWESLKSLENINILLYLGALMVVVAAGIFVGFNYQSLTGFSKTLFLAIFTFVFYFTGLFCYLKSKKIQQAGLTFTTIGLVLMPLVGLAAYKFIYGGENGRIIWLVTSMVVFLIYLLTLLEIKKVFLSYLLTLTALSLFESAISMFDVPIYYFFWGITIFAMISTIIKKYLKLNYEIDDPLAIIGQIVLPISLVISLCLGPIYDWSQAGINIILAAVVYLLGNFITEQQSQREYQFASSLVLFPVGAVLLVPFDIPFFHYIGFVLASIALIYSLFMAEAQQKWNDLRPGVLGVLSGFIMVAAILFVWSDPWYLFALLILTILMCSYSSYLLRQVSNTCIALAAVVYLPWLILMRLTSIFSLDYMALVYIIVALIIMLVRFNVLDKWLEGKVAGIIGYSSSLLIALIISIGAKNEILLAVLLLMALVLYLINMWERAKPLILLAMGFIYLATWPIANIYNFDAITVGLIITTVGIVMYLFSQLVTDEGKIYIRYSGIIGPYLGTCIGLNSEKSLHPIAMLFVAGVLSFYEGYEQKKDFAKYISTAVMIVSLELLFNYYNVKETQYYTIVWAAYFGIIAYLRFLKNDISGKDVAAIIGLGFLTIPLLFQAHYSKEYGYGLLLGIEGILLLIAGMLGNYKLIVRWGAVTLVIIVLDQMKDYLAAMPKWIIIGGIGIIFLVGATYLLSRRHDQTE